MLSTVDKDTASEFLRLALPLMSKYQVPVTPANYAVWFEYVAGTHLELKKAIEELMDKSQSIDEEVTEELHRRFLETFDEGRLKQARDALRGIVEGIDGSVSVADSEVSRYQESLAGYSEQLTGEMDAESLRNVIKGLSNETDSVRETSAALQDRLEDSHKEVESLKQELEQARREATTDALTGLANRMAFDQALERIRGNTDEDSPGHCLLMADIDKFKNINDTYGHLLGDKVIRFVGKAMDQCVKGKDMVARFGGEEYAILLPDTPITGAIALAENIRATIENGRLVRSDTREPIGTVTISIGVAHYRPGEAAKSLLERADRALYEAKQTGRNRVMVESDAVATGTEG